MEILTNLLSKVDITAIVATVVSFIAGLAFVKPKLDKALNVLGDVIDLLAEIREASADGKYSAEEIQAIAKEGEELLAEFKK